MSWLSKVKGWLSSAPQEEPAPPADAGPKASWLAADQSRFGVPVLDLSPFTQGVTSTSRDPDVAARAVSWGNSDGSELSGDLAVRQTHDCALRYPVADVFPDGVLSVPSAMEDKWVIAWRDGQIRMARSWTGVVCVVADARREGRVLVVERIREGEGSPLGLFGGPINTFDWMMRTHALGEILPLPLDDDGAALLESAPLSVFGPFGRKALCAAKIWDPPPIRAPLRSDGALLAAVRRRDHDAIRALAAAGVPLSPPGTFQGYTPLHVAAVLGDTALIDLLCSLGAGVNVVADRGTSVLGAAVVHKTPLSGLQALAAAGADVHHVNVDGFGLLHAAAETNRPELVDWLCAQGLELERTTRHGHTALHIAAALEHVEALTALLDAGARIDAPSPGGTPREVAAAEGKARSVAALDARR